jgi:geranylgeranyl pyrophosphate synthase/predicted secreted hydrolase
MSLEFKSGLKPQPADWPGPGSINLAVHDLPHASSTMEWWYVNSHLKTDDGRAFSMFAAFFRVDVSAAGAAERSYAHFLTWALVDPVSRRYSPVTLVDRKAPQIAIDELDKGRGPRDARLARALREVLAKGQVPLPDRLMGSDAVVATNVLSLDLDGNSLAKRDDGSYEIDLADQGSGAGCRLRFTIVKPVVRHGDDGVVRGLEGEDMFYYFSPRCRVEGSVRADGTWIEVAGDGWYDHEFGVGEEGSSRSEAKLAWTWLAVQLDNGYEISAYALVEKLRPAVSRGGWVIVVDPDGQRTQHSTFSLEPVGSWTSTRTFNQYPSGYSLTVPGIDVTLEVATVLANQEVITLISAPAFWEGAVDVRGIMSGQRVSGQGFIERSGTSVVETIDDFFSSVGRETRRAIDSLLPEHPTAAQALQLIGGPRREHFLDGVDVEQYARTVLKPIREIILRGGKAWRSYSVLACMDVVGGDSEPFRQWLALPELLHGGSLIIDDVQDRSDVRRGGPACHLIFGEPLAINSGCATYFLALIPVAASRLSDAMRVKIYEAYFEAMRAAHAGQAFDIDSLAGIMPGMVESGAGAELERRVLGIHRLKSAVAPGALARMAALIGGGTDVQAEGLGSLFEAYGLAFQIIDDVLNLRGFEENRKNRGEDVTQGKVTAPIAKAMGLMPLADRRTLWSLLTSKPTERGRILDVINMVDRCGALDACEAQARELVENAWRAVDPLVPDSQFKVRLRAFGWFVLDRHY